MELNNILGKLNSMTKSVGDKFINELTEALSNNKLTNESKVKLQDEKRKIIKAYGDIFEVKNRGVYKYSKDKEYEELKKDMYEGQKIGYYVLDENKKLRYDENLNDEIKEKINILKFNLLKEQKKQLETFRKEGEIYIVDEIGDDERYVYLTRKSDGEEFQDFNISNEIYERIKENNKQGKETLLVWNGAEYKIKR